MVQRQFLIVPLLLLAFVFGSARQAAAGYPPYLILQTPGSGPQHASHGCNPGLAQGVSTPAYSYGYFGVQPRTHASRHLGYYRNYTEWSHR